MGPTLFEIAQKIASAAGDNIKRLEKEKREIETRSAEIDAELLSLAGMSDRALEFEPKIHGQYQCPRCWVADQVQAPLIPQSSGDDADIFKCRRCQEIYSFEA